MYSSKDVSPWWTAFLHGPTSSPSRWGSFLVIHHTFDWITYCNEFVTLLSTRPPTGNNSSCWEMMKRLNNHHHPLFSCVLPKNNVQIQHCVKESCKFPTTMTQSVLHYIASRSPYVHVYQLLLPIPTNCKWFSYWSWVYQLCCYP
jgi:hypothetical protein